MKRFAPATERNSTAIMDVLRQVLPTKGDVLEIASGTGQHVVFFAPIFPSLRWHPTDVDDVSLDSIEAWLDDAGTPNIASPQRLDVTSEAWPLARADAIVCCNMIHIAPWSACLGLFAGAGRVLPKDGVLFLYGPFLQTGAETAQSNLDFNTSLKSRNPEWGIRSLDKVTKVAEANGLQLKRIVTMPANNLSLVFIKS